MRFAGKQRSGENGYPRDRKGPGLVLIVAGEASADIHGANLVQAMKRLNPGLEFRGIGGENMAQAGVETLFSASDMAVVGVTEFFSRLRTILSASNRLKFLLKTGQPDLLILLDYPGFNIHLAGIAKRFRIPVLYYISPQVWAWRRGRIRKIVRRVDRMAVILPFEKEFYSHAPMKVDYVGHPLLDECPSPCRKTGGMISGMEMGPGRPVVGMLPGSRKEEIRNLLPVMVETAEILASGYPHLQCVLPLAPGISPDFVHPLTAHAGVKINFFQGNIYEALRGCDVALVASGTATLETAIMGVPMVIVYRVSTVTYWIARMAVQVPYIGLVNLVAGEKVVPELIQGDVTAEKLADEARAILDNDEIRERMKENLGFVKEKLGRGGASERTARIALEMMGY